ncbi:MAG: hypothetical protein V4844_09835 [Pseudomonadota bacterium]
MTSLVPDRPAPELESALAAVEHRLSALGMALCVRDTVGIDLHATELHRALALAVDQFGIAARRGSVPPDLRLRLVSTSGQVAAQRESLARATAALDRAIDVLMPRENASTLYSTQGSADRPGRGGSVLA